MFTGTEDGASLEAMAQSLVFVAPGCADLTLLAARQTGDGSRIRFGGGTGDNGACSPALRLASYVAEPNWLRMGHVNGVETNFIFVI